GQLTEDGLAWALAARVSRHCGHVPTFWQATYAIVTKFIEFSNVDVFGSSHQTPDKYVFYMCCISQLEMSRFPKNTGMHSRWFGGAEPFRGLALQIIRARTDFIDYKTLYFSECRRGSTRTHDGKGTTVSPTVVNLKSRDVMNVGRLTCFS